MELSNDYHMRIIGVFIVMFPDDLSQSNSHNDFPFESSNDDHVSVIMR